MIIVDIEASGGSNFYRVGVWQIGAIEFENPSNTFLQEAQVDDDDIVEADALPLIEKTEKELRDKNKQSQKKLLENFFAWVSRVKDPLFVSHNPFDYGLLRMKAGKYGLEFPFHHKTLDLHTIAVAKYFEVRGKLPFEKGKSDLTLSNILQFCGIEDKRRLMEENKLIRQGDPHTGLVDAKLEAECLSRILYGKGLLKEFENFKIPKYLK